MRVAAIWITFIFCVLLTDGCLIWKNLQFTNELTNNFQDWNIIQGPWGKESLSFIADPEGGSDVVLRIFYKNGSYSKTSHRGSGFYSRTLSPGRQCARLAYDVYFEPDFDFVLGGKLPGLWGGSTKCSGGRNADDCFSTRFMWRAQGDGEVYAYIPDNQRDDFCSESTVRCNFNYGHSLGRGTWRYPVGQWVRIEQEVKLNDAGFFDGYVKVWMDGVKKYELNNLVFRSNSTMQIEGIVFSSFFGGSSVKYASTGDRHSYFKNFQLYSCN